MCITFLELFCCHFESANQEFENEMNAANILRKAVEYDTNGRRLEAFSLYEDGIRALLEHCRSETDDTRKVHYQNKIKEYIDRAEKIKQTIMKNATAGQVVEMIPISEGSTGHSYNSLFGKYLTESVKEIEVDEPYIREHYQYVNLIVFLELVVKKCRLLKYVKVRTTVDSNLQAEQQRNFDGLIENLRSQGVCLTFEICENLHDRQITLSNGYIIKIGRGLHFYNGPNPRYSLGFTDFDFRKCKQTNVDIYQCQS